MKKLIYSIITLCLFIFSINLSAQKLDMSAEIRPRFENKHGFKTLLPTNADGTSFISQRTRLNLNFQQNKMEFGMILQNVRVWGDVSTLSSRDLLNSFHEAWTSVMLSDNLSLKMGRQEIIYDDHRIFGNVGWAQQARSHDAMIFKYKKDTHKLDVGFAMNADSESNVDVLYSNVAGYKSFQYLWYHGQFNDFGLSILALNTGKEYFSDSTSIQQDFMQTVGPRLTYKKGKFDANATAYFQMGKLTNQDVNSSYFGLDFGYKVTNEIKLGAGMEYLSGKDSNDTDTGISSFAPLFGTNHKFNGLMDYFYVGNHGGSVGLTDIYAVIAYNKKAFSAKLVPHFFSTAADLYNTEAKLMDSNLGTEIDLTMGYKIASNISVNAGYSVMSATDSMEVLKGGDKDSNNTWGWLMFTFKPKLYTTPEK